jgi:hypothetical protein
MSPDAREQYFFSNSGMKGTEMKIPPTQIRYGNPVDHPYIDLNGDGMISLMRIKDPAGEWITHEEDRVNGQG